MTTVEEYKLKKEVILEKKRRLLEQLIDLQMEVTANKDEIEKINEKFDKLRKIEDTVPTEFTK